MACGGISTVSSRSCGHTGVATAAAWAWGIVWAASMAGLFFIASKFAEVFRDFGVSLPWTTRAAMNAALSLSSSPLAWALSLFVLGVIVAVCLAAGRARSARPAWTLLWLGIAAGPVVAFVGLVSLMLPLTRMINQMNGGA